MAKAQTTIIEPEPPLVSVIMPAYNVSAYIAEAIDSVLAQTYKNFQILVVNDGSRDTPELECVLAPYMREIIYIKQENAGTGAARNTALRASRGEFVALLDPDDIWEPDYLAVQIAALQGDPTIDVLYCNALIFGDAPEAGLTFMDLCPSSGEVTFERLIRQECNVFSSVTARRDIIFKAGLFDEELQASEDFDLWLRIARIGGRFAYHRRVLARYRRRAESLSIDPIRLTGSTQKVIRKASCNLDLTANEKIMIERELNLLEATLQFCEGKKAFLSGELSVAIEKLSNANLVLASPKVKLLLFLLRLSPRATFLLYAVTKLVPRIRRKVVHYPLR